MAQESGLAGARCTNQRDHLTLPDSQVHVTQSMLAIGEMLVELPDMECSIHGVIQSRLDIPSVKGSYDSGLTGLIDRSSTDQDQD